MLVADSAYPLTTYPATWNGQPIVGWGFYLGGNTPHVWTAGEVAELKRHYRFLLPIYTCSNPADRDPQIDGHEAVTALQALGVPRGPLLVQLDYETAVDSAYEAEFGAVLAAAGYVLELYGSASTVAQNLRPDGGYDEAAWTGRDAPPADTADQFADVGLYDLNDFRPTAPLWDVTATPTNPAAPAAIEEDEMPQQIERTALHPDEYAYGVPAGRTQVVFFADGYNDAPARLRVVLWGGENPDVHDGVEVGGTAKKHVPIPLPAGTTAVTVRREDGSDFPVGVSFS